MEEREKNRRSDVLIVGAGASGMTAAIYAARAGASVALLEHMDRAGKKILSTGNGRCNFSNRVQLPECYRSRNPQLAWQTLQRFPLDATLSFFEGLGLSVKDRNGYLYPASDQASSVRELLLLEINRLGVELFTGCRIQWIRRTKGRDACFEAGTDQGTFTGNSLILAAGSSAAPATGSDGSEYGFAEAFGHRLITPLPALTQLRCAEKDYKKMAGVRTEAQVTLFTEKRGSRKDGAERWEFAARDRGELQLTDYGISGIPVFQVSRYAAEALHEKRKVRAVIDFLPSMNEEQTWEMMKNRTAAHPERTCGQWMTGLLNGKLGNVLLARAGLSDKTPVSQVGETGWRSLFDQIKAFGSDVVEANGFAHAQVCAGGVDLAEVDPLTMESRLVGGLYFCGEILDVDGICGGYNLQWAWSGGAAAGMSAAERSRS